MLPPGFTPNVISQDEVDSTSSVLRQLAGRGAGEGTVVTALRQTQGRGSGGRQWFSPDGGLYLSVLLSSKVERRATDLCLIAGVAVAQTVRNLLPKSKAVSLKWPNDCLVGWKKVGGILSETLSGPQGGLCIVGIGINVNLTEKDLGAFKDRPFGATSFVMEAEGQGFDLPPIRDALLKKLFAIYDVYHDGGFQPVQYLWERNCQFIGKRVQLEGSSVRPGATQEGLSKPVIGTCLGIDDLGGLVLSNAQGERRSYFSGEITCYWP